MKAPLLLIEDWRDQDAVIAALASALQRFAGITLQAHSLGDDMTYLTLSDRPLSDAQFLDMLQSLDDES